MLFFPILSNKECDFASEPPKCELDDIINRLKKFNVNKSLGPDLIQPEFFMKLQIKLHIH